MKIFKTVIFILVFLAAGYFLGSYRPLSGFLHSGANVIGNAELKVTVLRPDKTPATNLEVDVATDPGAPLTGGITKTDQNGVASFKLKPGNYFIFFNAINFPKNLEYHETQQIEVTQAKTATITVNLLPGK